MPARNRLLLAGLLATLVLAAPVLAAPPLDQISAARIAADAAGGNPSVVVVWAPGCLACRKSLGEIERFAERAGPAGVAVVTVVPAEVHGEARAMIESRGLGLSVRGDGGGLDTESRRLLLDQPIAYAVARDGRIVGARAGLLGAWMLDELAARAAE